MSETKFTKGPWVIDGKYSTFLAVSANGAVVCDVSCCHDGYHIKPSSEELANARLISCAPDMYDALDAITDSSNPEDMLAVLMEVKSEIAELLKRARGE